MKYTFVPSSRHYCAGDQPADLMIRSRDKKLLKIYPRQYTPWVIFENIDCLYLIHSYKATNSCFFCRKRD